MTSNIDMKSSFKVLFELVIELVVFYFMFLLFDIEKVMGISFVRYLFVFITLFIVLRDKHSNNLIWQDAKNILEFYIVLFIISLVVRPLKYITYDVVISNALYLFVTFVITLFIRKFLHTVLFRTLSNNVLIVGIGHHAQIAADTCKANRYSLMNVKGFLSLNAPQFDLYQEEVVEGRIVNYKDLYKFILENNIDTALIAIPQISKKDMTKITYDLNGKLTKIKYMPQINGMYSYNARIEDYDGQLLINVRETKDVIYTSILKRIIDIIAGLVGCLCLIPLTIIIKIANLTTGDKAPVFFTQDRIGLYGKKIKIFKYRSMIPNAEQVLEEMMAKDKKIKKEYLTNKKLENDPRITKVGNFIRKTSLDEFPQFINVLVGSMSLVGPRPYLFREIPDMGEFYKTIILTKPGITGMWQVSGRSDVAFERRCRLDEYYTKNQNFWLDFTIVIKTIKAVFASVGAK